MSFEFEFIYQSLLEPQFINSGKDRHCSLWHGGSLKLWNKSPNGNHSDTILARNQRQKPILNILSYLTFRSSFHQGGESNQDLRHLKCDVKFSIRIDELGLTKSSICEPFPPFPLMSAELWLLMQINGLFKLFRFGG